MYASFLQFGYKKKNEKKRRTNFQERHLDSRHTNEDYRFSSGQELSAASPKDFHINPFWN